MVKNWLMPRRRRWRRAWRGAVILFSLVASLFLVGIGCSVMRPLPGAADLAERLGDFPLDCPPLRDSVTIHWNEHAVPFIEAGNEDDLAFALGMVNAHLRLGQITLMRLLVHGRLAEVAGPPARDIDHALRILDIGRAAPAIEAALPERSRRWLEEFAAGLNFYQSRQKHRPHELAVLGISPEPWSVADIIAIGRLSAIDLHWLTWMRLLRLPPEDAAAVLEASLGVNGGSSPSFAAATSNPALDPFIELLGGHGRFGSNTLVVGGGKTASGAAMIASDPHVGMQLPAMWFVVGLKSPETNVVGMTIAGLPFVLFGRNPDIAWGATNMRALASELVALPTDAEFASAETVIGTRWWFDARRTVRQSSFGPLVSDIPFLAEHLDRPVALRWLGHEPSDEITPFLDAMRAKDWRGFHTAFAPYATPGANILYADRHGNIGQLMAAAIPRRRIEGTPEIISEAATAGNWELITQSELPYSYNPSADFLASANNLPAGDVGATIGYVFPPDDRYRRLAALAGAADGVDLEFMRATQRDVDGGGAVILRNRVVHAAEDSGTLDGLAGRFPELWRELRGWDGQYDRDSRGALAFHAFASELFDELAAKRLPALAAAQIKESPELAISTLASMLGSAPESLLAAALEAASSRAAAKMAEVEGGWGEIQVLGVNHFLAAIPLIGWRYRFGEHPYQGANSTLRKAARTGFDAERRQARYGANARQVSDMASPDENYFVILGGQDGRINSHAFADQVEMWLEDQYMKVPLDVETARRDFLHKTVLRPAAK